jgi:hypothetical protein
VCDFAVARMMYLLEPSSQESAISLATALDAELEKVDLQVTSLNIRAASGSISIF